MALKNNWVDKVDGEDIVQAADINEIANAVIELEGALGRDTIIWQINQDYSAVALGDVVTTTDSSLTTISGKTPNVNDYVIDNAGNILRVHYVTAGGGLVLEMVSLAAIDKRNITLGLHTDGLIYIFIDGVPTGNGIALPSGASGDVVGNVDSENNIVLLGNLADGTYTVKYEMEDGSTVDIGGLVLGTTARLPSEYQEVEWVQIVNDEDRDVYSCVHTNIPWNTATKIIAKVQNITSSNANDMVISAWVSDTQKAAPYVATRTTKTPNTMWGYVSELTGYAVSPSDIVATDTNANVFTATFTAASTADICFGGYHDASYSHPHKWYYVEIYNGDTLLGNFIPCYRKADNVNGFYDLVSGTFCINADSQAYFAYRGNDV